MYYQKTASHIKPKTRSRLVISTFEGINTTIAEELVPFKYSPMSYNYKMSGGILQHGYGLNKVEFWDECVSQPKAIFEYRRYDKVEGAKYDRIMVVGLDGSVWQYKLKDSCWQQIDGLAVSSKICAVNYRYKGQDVLLLSSTEDGLFIIDGDSYIKVDNSPCITSMCMHYDRVYCTVAGEKNAVWFSDDFDPSCWNISLDEAGFIEFSDDLGAVNSVVSFLDRVYIFRDYGINRLTAFNDQSNFSVSRLYLSTGKIIADSVKICGSCIIFQADNSVYSFDGLDVSRIMTNLTGLFAEEATSIGVFHNGCYYLACKLNIGEATTENNALIEYRMYDGELSVMYGFNVTCMASISSQENKLMLLNNGIVTSLDNSGNLFNTPLKKLWTTPRTALGLTDTVKILKEIIINTRYDLTIEVELDEETHVYYIDGNTKYQTIKINKKFDTIKLAIISESDKARVSRIELIIDTR